MLYLPKNEKELSNAILTMAARGDEARWYSMGEWLVNMAFLQGVRDFKTANWNRRKTNFPYVSNDGKLEFRNEEALRNITIEMGRFQGIDVRPSCKMLGWGLDRLRAASIGQVTLDHEVPDWLVSQVRVPFLEQLLVCGFSAVTSWVENAGLFSGKVRMEVISPWEILPIPGAAQSPYRTQGILRTRLVPYEWLKQDDRIKGKLRDKEKLQIQDVEWGEMQAASRSSWFPSWVSTLLGFLGSGFSSTIASDFGDDASVAEHDEGRKWVQLTEAWTYQPDRMVRRYVAMAGEKIIYDKNYEEQGKEVWLPIGMARYYPSGFYGRAYASPLVFWTHETEQAATSIFQMVREWDSMGILALPTGLGITDSSFRMSGRPKKLLYSPDPLDPSGIQPLQLKPFDPGAIPQQAIQLGSSYTEKVAGQSSLFAGDAPGRADSQAALGFLLETSNVGIESPGNEMADAFTTVYAAVLDASRKRLTANQAARIVSLDDMTVGIVIDDEGKLDLSKNPIPSPKDVKLNIRSRTPPSPTQLIGQLDKSLQMGLIDQLEYALEVYRKGLEVPVGHREQYEHWRMCRMSIRALFNDGKTPGGFYKTAPDGEVLEMPVTVDYETVDPELYLRELAAFMASDVFHFAEKEVKNAFKAWKKQLMAVSGKNNMMPEQMPPPDAVGMVPGMSPEQPMEQADMMTAGMMM